jgi:hypothetical protein
VSVVILTTFCHVDRSGDISKRSLLRSRRIRRGDRLEIPPLRSE